MIRYFYEVLSSISYFSRQKSYNFAIPVITEVCARMYACCKSTDYLFSSIQNYELTIVL